jgi:hypothetical protein
MVRRLRSTSFMSTKRNEQEKAPAEPAEKEKPGKLLRHPTLDETREESMADEGGQAGAEMEAEDLLDEDEEDRTIAHPLHREAHRERRYG